MSFSHNQRRAPLIEALRKLARAGRVPLHTPGHGQGNWVDRGLKQLLGPALLIDTTELPGLDDLAAPHGPIAQAQVLAAQAFGAEDTFFLVNGATAGLQAVLLAVLRPGDAVILPRYVHRSVLSALVLARACPVWLPPRWDAAAAAPYGPLPEDVAAALRGRPEARLVLVVRPTYQGYACDLTELVRIAHEHGVPLLVDEAHGAHYAFHPELPQPALRAGADAVVHGVHKTLGACTGAGMLHLRGPRLDRARVQAALRLVQTSSPSYLLMGSLDGARRLAANHGERALQQQLGRVRRLRRALAQLPGVEVVESRWGKLPGSGGYDPLRLWLSASRRGWSGPDLARYLAQHQIDVEMAEGDHALCLLGPAVKPAALRRLLQALRELPERRRRTQHLQAPAWPPLPPQAMLPAEAYQSRWEPVPLEAAAGRVMAQAISVAPPGIPLVMAGEALTREVVDYLRWARENRLTLLGLDDRGCVQAVATAERSRE